jgi:hypothetical protein
MYYVGMGNVLFPKARQSKEKKPRTLSEISLKTYYFLSIDYSTKFIYKEEGFLFIQNGISKQKRSMIALHS